MGIGGALGRARARLCSLVFIVVVAPGCGGVEELPAAIERNPNSIGIALRDPVPSPKSCVLPTDCNDGDVCTTDFCDLLTFTCKYTPVASCCNQLSDCAGGPICTLAKCVTHLCLFEPILGCGNDSGSDGAFVDSAGPDGSGSCTGAGDCDDADPCSLDLCVAGLCAHTVVGGCCQAPQECNNGPLCTLPKCILNTCVFDSIVGCDAGSSDGGATDGPTSLDTATDVASEGGGSGVCNPSDGLTCSDSDSCTLDVCLPVIFECVHAPLELCCNSLHACSPGQSCVNGTCTCGPSGCDGGDAGSPPTCTVATDCDDGNDCTFDLCAPGTNICAHAPLAGCGTTDGGSSSDGGNEVSSDASSDAATDVSSTTDTATDARVTNDTDASLDTTSTDVPLDVFAGDAVDGRADGTASPDGLSDTTGRDRDGTYDGAGGSAGAIDGASSDRAAGGGGRASDSGALRDVSREGGESDVAWDLRGGCSCRSARSEDHTPAALLWNAVALGVAVIRRRREKH